MHRQQICSECTCELCTRLASSTDRKTNGHVFLARFPIAVTVFLPSRPLSSVLIAWLIKELRAIGKASLKERDSVLGEKTTLMKWIKMRSADQGDVGEKYRVRPGLQTQEEICPFLVDRPDFFCIKSTVKRREVRETKRKRDERVWLERMGMFSH